jgi:uncharacterized membrane protein YebE (DUF533 family)
MSTADRILPLCDLLLGAAYADNTLHDKERAEVQALVEEWAGGKLPKEAATHIAKFDPKKFDLAKVAAAFRGDSDDAKRKLLFLVSAVIEADEEIDFAEDDYLRALATALALPASALEGLTVDVEPAELAETFEHVRKAPPPPPPSKKK